MKCKKCKTRLVSWINDVIFHKFHKTYTMLMLQAQLSPSLFMLLWSVVVYCRLGQLSSPADVSVCVKNAVEETFLQSVRHVPTLWRGRVGRFSLDLVSSCGKCSVRHPIESHSLLNQYTSHSANYGAFSSVNLYILYISINYFEITQYTSINKKS